MIGGALYYHVVALCAGGGCRGAHGSREAGKPQGGVMRDRDDEDGGAEAEPQRASSLFLLRAVITTYTASPYNPLIRIPYKPIVRIPVQSITSSAGKKVRQPPTTTTHATATTIPSLEIDRTERTRPVPRRVSYSIPFWNLTMSANAPAPPKGPPPGAGLPAKVVPVAPNQT